MRSSTHAARRLSRSAPSASCDALKDLKAARDFANRRHLGLTPTATLLPTAHCRLQHPGAHCHGLPPTATDCCPALLWLSLAFALLCDCWRCHSSTLCPAPFCAGGALAKFAERPPHLAQAPHCALAKRPPQLARLPHFAPTTCPLQLARPPHCAPRRPLHPTRPLSPSIAQSTKPITAPPPSPATTPPSSPSSSDDPTPTPTPTRTITITRCLRFLPPKSWLSARPSVRKPRKPAARHGAGRANHDHRHR